eukprot:7248026-Prymnesium_polylepis.1
MPLRQRMQTPAAQHSSWSFIRPVVGRSFASTPPHCFALRASHVLSGRLSPFRAIAGFCAVSKTLVLPQTVEVEACTLAVESNGMNATFGDQMHCVAAEPHATFLSIRVIDNGVEIAYES